MKRSVETSCAMTAIGKRGARSSGPIGWCVPGWRTGGGGFGRSAARLYQDVGMASSGKRNRVRSSIAALLHNQDRLAPVPRHPPRDERRLRTKLVLCPNVSAWYRWDYHPATKRLSPYSARRRG